METERYRMHDKMLGNLQICTYKERRKKVLLYISNPTIWVLIPKIKRWSGLAYTRYSLMKEFWSKQGNQKRRVKFKAGNNDNNIIQDEMHFLSLPSMLSAAVSMSGETGALEWKTSFVHNWYGFQRGNGVKRYQFTSVWLRVGWILRYSNDFVIRKSLQNKDKLKIADPLDGW